MPAKKTKTIEQAVRQTLPGWKIVQKKRAADAPRYAPAAAASDDAVEVSPGLAAQQAKYFGVAKDAPKRGSEQGHAEFVTVAPASQPDNLTVFHKVVLYKNGKVIAQQG